MVNSQNRARLRTVGRAVADHSIDAVFVGGAVVGLYGDDPARTEARPTEDIDVVVEVISLSENEELETKLRKVGFQPDRESSVICRYKYQGITVDIMPTDSRILGFSNRWYKEGMNDLETIDLGDQILIQVFDFPYFLATKIEALKTERRGSDFRMNSDFEDIIYLFDNRTDADKEIQRAEGKVKNFIASEITELLKRHNIHEEILSNLEFQNQRERQIRMINLWQAIARANK